MPDGFDHVRARADHETGHFLVANELRLGIVFWVTIEPRLGSGGSVGIEEFGPNIPGAHRAMFRLAGFVGNLVGMRNRGELITPEALALFEKGAEHDLDGLDEQVRAEIFEPTHTLVADNWAHCRDVSDSLVERTTLYTGEAYMIWEGNRLETLRAWNRGQLEQYRANRRAVSPPPKWVRDSNEQCPAGTWFEDFDTWRRRADEQ